MKRKYLIFASCLAALLVWLWPSTVIASGLDDEPVLSDTYTYTNARFVMKGIEESSEATIVIKHLLSCTEYTLHFCKDDGWKTDVWELLTGDYAVTKATANESDLSKTNFKEFTIADDDTVEFTVRETVPITAWRLIKKNLLYIIAIPTLLIALIVVRKKGIADKKLFTK